MQPKLLAAAKRPTLTLSARCEITAADAANPKAARTFRMVANTGEPMNLYPFEHPVVIDLASVDLSGLPIPALYDHCADVDFVCGTVDAVELASGELVATGRFTPTDDEFSYGRKVLAKADAGYVWQTSVGGDPKTLEEIKAGAEGKANGRTYPGPVLIARGVVLREISFVVLGGDRRTSAVVARNKSRAITRIKGGRMEFEEFVQSMGFSVADLDETQTANMKLVYAEKYGEAEVAAEDDTVKEEEVVAEDGTVKEEEPAPTAAKKKANAVNARAQVAAIRARVLEINKLCAEYPKAKATDEHGRKVPLLAHAIAQNWTVDRVKTHLLTTLREDRKNGPAVITPKAPDQNERISAMQAALLLRSGVKLDDKRFQSAAGYALNIPAFLRAGLNDAQRNKLMEAGHRLSGLHAMDIAREFAHLSGKNLAAGSRDAILQAAFSSASFTNSFTTNVNAVLLVSYMDTPDTTGGWVQEQEVNDFRTQERPRATKGSGLKRLAAGGTADDYSLSDVGESYKIGRYARKFQVDEQNFIDDSLGVLQQIPTEMGQAAARLRPDLVYAILLDNPTLAATALALFSASNPSANLLTTAALTSTTLKAAIAAMMKFQENSVNLNLRPSHLIVPPTLMHGAAELINSSTIFKSNGASSTVEFGSDNSLKAEGLTLVSDARLENGVTDPSDDTAVSGSASSWFMACNYAHTIEVGYLRGTGRAPQVRSFNLDRGQWGMGWDIKMDLGAKALDWKGLVKNTA